MLYIKKHFRNFTIISAVAALAFFNFWADNDKILRNVYVGNVNLSRLNKSEAENTLKSSSENLLNAPLKIIVGDFVKSTTLESIGAEINLQKTIEAVYQIGRVGPWYKKAYEKFKLFFKTENLKFKYSINKEKLNQKMLEYFPTLEQPSQSATLIYDARKNSFMPKKESLGHVVDKGPIVLAMENYIENLQLQDIRSSVVMDYPQVMLDGISQAQDQAQSIISSAPYLLILANDEIAPLENQTLASFLQFTPDQSGRNQLNLEISTSTVAIFLNTVGIGFNKPVIDAVLVVEDHKVAAFNLPQEGRTIAIDQSVSSIIEALNSRQKEIKIYFTYQQPKVDEEKIKEYGLTAKLGQGVSNFFGSSESRKFNISLGASKFNGLLIKPGEEFSFNDILGDVDKEHGWKAELVIKNGGVSPDYGGGLCQVSTTMFRAAVNAGLQITERYPHAFPVRYYDPQGFDATIYPPSPDLKFINNTPNYLMIQTKIEGNNLYFEIFGTNDSRITKVLGPYITQQSSDGSLSTKLTQQVWKNGEIWFEKTFYSNYQSPNKFKIQRNPLE